MSHTAILDGAAGAPPLDGRTVADWRATWHAMMREQLPCDDALAVAFDAVEEALPGGPCRLLDLGGGPGTVAEIVLSRWPRCEVTLLDIDPVLLALARAALPERASVLDCDLTSPIWAADVGGEFDLVLAVMVVHYLAATTLDALYRQVRRRLSPGGILLVVDAMADGRSAAPDSGPTANADQAQSRAATWESWWQQVGESPAMASLVHARQRRLPATESAASVLTVDRFRSATAAAGFSAVREVWRRGEFAAMVVRV